MAASQHRPFSGKCFNVSHLALDAKEFDASSQVILPSTSSTRGGSTNSWTVQMRVNHFKLISFWAAVTSGCVTLTQPGRAFSVSMVKCPLSKSQIASPRIGKPFEHGSCSSSLQRLRKPASSSQALRPHPPRILPARLDIAKYSCIFRSSTPLDGSFRFDRLG